MTHLRLQNTFFLSVLVSLLLLSACSSSKTETPLNEDPPQEKEATTTKDPSEEELNNFQVTLEDGSSLDIYYQTPTRRDLAINVANMLRECHNTFLAVFGELPPFSTTIVLVDRDLFYAKTASPEWVHALYHRGKIFIPISPDEPIDYIRLYRSLKHEYTHSVVNVLTDGRCPAWIDEGLAQWFEGADKKSDHYILANWLKSHRAISLVRLQKGFVTLNEKQAKVGYAQSFFAVQDLINTYGVKRFPIYFEFLRQEKSHPRRAFFKAFGLTERSYEKRLRIKMNRWAISYRRT